MSTAIESGGILGCCRPKFPSSASSIPNSSVTTSFQRRMRQQQQDEVEAILVQGMNELSFDELQREQEDLHGVLAGVDEDIRSTEGMLQVLKDHLDGIKTGTVFEAAEARNPSYVHRRDFQIMFLRGNRNHPKAAAEQMIKYFDLKQELFGEERLVRDITVQDLNEEDMCHLMNGSAQLAGCKDRSGRAIAWGFPGLRSDKLPIFNEVRARFYLGNDIVNSMDSHDLGIVMVNYCVGRFEDKSNGAGFKEGMKLALAFPCNIASFHLCFHNKAQSIMAKAAVSVMPPSLRAKTKVHCGSHYEIQYILQTYGIPREALPFDLSTNELDLTSHRRWLQECVMKEKMENASKEVSDRSKISSPVLSSVNKTDIVQDGAPNENDVLCIGRRFNGKGNERLISLAVENADAYDTGSQMDRKIIVTSMMEEIWRHGGRFLRLDADSGGYVEVPNKAMREKISQTFRNLRFRRVARQSKAAAGQNRDAANFSQAPFSSFGSASSRRDSSHLQQLPIVDVLKAEDVLFGKMKDHGGNQRLRTLVENVAVEYDAANRGVKKQIADRLMKNVKDTGGRFLRPLEDGRWEVVPDKVADKKIAAHFRNLRRKQRR